MDSDRQQKLVTWLGENSYEKTSLVNLSGDASFRKYYRVKKNELSYVVMDCPPDKENLSSFISVTKKLHKAKVNVPKLFECHHENGFLVLSDLGDDLYSRKLDSETVYCLYTDALETIVKMQRGPFPKKYTAIVRNKKTKKTRKIHFGDRRYQQFKDRTKLKLYKSKNHGTRRRMQNYYNRHSGTKKRNKAIKKERRKSKGFYNAKILSHEYLW